MSDAALKYDISNVVLRFDMGFGVKTIELYNAWLRDEVLNDYYITIYDNEKITGWLDIQPTYITDRAVKVRLYPSGRGMVVGARDKDEAVKVLRDVHEKLAKSSFRK